MARIFFFTSSHSVRRSTPRILAGNGTATIKEFATTGNVKALMRETHLPRSFARTHTLHIHHTLETLDARKKTHRRRSEAAPEPATALEFEGRQAAPRF